MHQNKNSLSKEAKEKMIVLLNARLADAIDLSLQAKQAHWNVKGPHFYGLHLLFDEIHEKVEAHADLIAERCVQLGGTAMGTVRDVSKATKLAPYPEDTVEGRAHVDALSSALAKFGGNVREAIDEAEEIGDQAGHDMFTQIDIEVDKYTWFVEAHLEGKS